MRKINRNKNREVIISVSAEYKWNFYCENCKDYTYKVSMKKINPKYFSNAIEFHGAYELFFKDLVDVAEKEDRKVGIIEFLQDSVDNNYMLSDSLSQQRFKVKKDHIYTTIDNNYVDLTHTGEFIIDNYKVNTSWSYMFFTDLKTNKQFMYYGD